jgi:hypothetical protein
VKRIKTKHVAELMGTTIFQIQGSMQLNLLDIGVYKKKPGAERGSYIIIPSRLAAEMKITEQELFERLEQIGW